MLKEPFIKYVQICDILSFYLKRHIIKKELIKPYTIRISIPFAIVKILAKHFICIYYNSCEIVLI